MEEMFCSFTEMNDSKNTKIQQIKRRLFIKSGLEAKMKDDKSSGDSAQLAKALKFEENEIIPLREFVKLHKQTQTDVYSQDFNLSDEPSLSNLIEIILSRLEIDAPVEDLNVSLGNSSLLNVIDELIANQKNTPSFRDRLHAVSSTNLNTSHGMQSSSLANSTSMSLLSDSGNEKITKDVWNNI